MYIDPVSARQLKADLAAFYSRALIIGQRKAAGVDAGPSLNPLTASRALGAWLEGSPPQYLPRRSTSSSNSRRSPSLSVGIPARSTAEICTNASGCPSSR